MPRDTAPDFLTPRIHDELRYNARHEFVQNLRKETLTFRNDPAQQALPMRRLGSFLPGDGVGGAGTHWSGLQWRWTEWEHRMYSGTVARYGRKIIPQDMNLQDWPIDYHELEPYYDRFEKLCGTSGKAGNLQWPTDRGGQYLRGATPQRVSEPAADAVTQHAVVREGRAGHGVSPVSHSGRERLTRIHKSRRRRVWALSLLWVLHRLWM